MRIRIYRAFASNNSGSYTIVGSFESAEVASEVAEQLRTVCAEHDAWHADHGYEKDGESPLDKLAREHGLTEQHPGREDCWSEHGPGPSLVAMGHQVLLHAPYTVTMPRLFGELFYKRGGRVTMELDHSHEDLCVHMTFYIPGAGGDDAEQKQRMDTVEDELRLRLPSLIQRNEHDNRPPIEPVFHGNAGRRSRQLSAVFNDLVEGVEGVREIVARHDLRLHVRIEESPHGATDPFAHLRSLERPWGKSRVILWSTGEDRIRALKALREVMGTELTEAKQALEGLPKEVLVAVDHEYAERAVQVLRGAGCEAEAVVPVQAGKK